MRLVVGLGNPGPGHAGNRHNIGFLAADLIVRRYGFGPWRSRFHGLAAEGEIAGEKIIVLKPETYMNDSGRAVAAAAKFYKLAPEQILVIHDEVDLVPGKIRVKQGGGAGGHNGLRSVDAHVGPTYWRIRLGVGHPGSAELVRYYVLQNFAKEEQPLFGRLIEATVEALPQLIAGDANGFMNKVTVAVNPPRPNAKRETETGGDSAGQDPDQRK
ncbi:MAG: peptidyl-tRNA hydrolase, family [Rhodospirillaceae bacterium]|nr:peptidyl-tRNA hydrolase, family [Rhodospirillaceae bacterium]